MRSPVVDDLATAVDAVAAVDVSGLSVEQLQQLTQTVHLHSGRLTGIENRALAELSQRTGGHVPDRPGSGTYSPVHAWWRDAARTSGPAAGTQVRTAQALRELPLIAAAVVTGRLTPEAGRLLARLVGPIDPQTLRDCQPELLQVITGLPPDAVARQVAHWLATFCEPPRWTTTTSRPAAAGGCTCTTSTTAATAAPSSSPTATRRSCAPSWKH